jgi:hypothetical protein
VNAAFDHDAGPRPGGIHPRGDAFRRKPVARRRAMAFHAGAPQRGPAMPLRTHALIALAVVLAVLAMPAATAAMVDAAQACADAGGRYDFGQVQCDVVAPRTRMPWPLLSALSLGHAALAWCVQHGRRALAPVLAPLC